MCGARRIILHLRGIFAYRATLKMPSVQETLLRTYVSSSQQECHPAQCTITANLPAEHTPLAATCGAISALHLMILMAS